MAWSTILVEIVGGLAVILGLFVTLASLPMAAVLLVAMFTVHLPYGFSSIKLEAVTAPASAGLRSGPALPGLSGSPGLGWSWTIGDGWPDHKAEESQIFPEQAGFNCGNVKQKPNKSR